MNAYKALSVGVLLLLAPVGPSKSGGVIAASAAPAALAAHRVTFAGFQPLPDGSARLFVHLTSKPEITKAIDKQNVTYTLADTDSGVRNNRNPLDVRHFDSLLLRAQLVPAGRNLELRLRLRKAMDIRHGLVRLTDGTYSLQIDLPALTP